MASIYVYHNEPPGGRLRDWAEGTRPALLRQQEAIGNIHLFQRRRSDGSIDYCWTMATPWTRRLEAAVKAGVFKQEDPYARIAADHRTALADSQDDRADAADPSAPADLQPASPGPEGKPARRARRVRQEPLPAAADAAPEPLLGAQPRVSRKRKAKASA